VEEKKVKVVAIDMVASMVGNLGRLDLFGGCCCIAFYLFILSMSQFATVTTFPLFDSRRNLLSPVLVNPIPPNRSN